MKIQLRVRVNPCSRNYEQPLSIEKLSAPTERHSALQQRVLPYCDYSHPSISNGKLLNIEGQGRPVLQENASPPRPLGTQTLRRKGKFCSSAELAGSRPRGITKKTSSGDMMQSMFYYQHDKPSYQDWTQRFEQMSVHQPETFHRNLPSPVTDLPYSEARYSRKRSSYVQPPAPNFGHRKATSEKVMPRERPRFVSHKSHESQSIFQDYLQQSHVQAGAIARDSFHTAETISQPSTPSRHNEQQSSWSNAPANLLQQDYIVSPSQLQTSWENRGPNNQHTRLFSFRSVYELRRVRSTQ